MKPKIPISNDRVTSGELLDLVIDEILDKQRAGQKVQLNDFVTKYPMLAEQLQEIFPTLLLVENIADVAPGGSKQRQARKIDPDYPESLGDFRLIREIGRGGMGVVFEAEQTSLKRQVAVKVLAKHLAQDVKCSIRFLREAQSAARLHHSSIVPVFGIGQQQGYSFYAMQYIAGHGLDRLIRAIRLVRKNNAPVMQGDESEAQKQLSEITSLLHSRDIALEQTALDHSTLVLANGRSLDSDSISFETDTTSDEFPPESGQLKMSSEEPDSKKSEKDRRHRGAKSNKRFHRNVAIMGFQVAQALHYAHSNGTVHRDIKPSNLMVDSSARVWLTDFGLAKIESEHTLTHDGDIIGTLRYMSSEQLDGVSAPSCDIYSLGATLYELATLQPAIPGSNRSSILQQIKDYSPIRPRQFDHRIPRDLETIIMKSLEKNPKDRYASAKLMADDLYRFIIGAPIVARPVSLSERVYRWAKANRSVAVLFSLLLTGLVVVTIASVYAAIFFRELASREKDNRDRAETAQDLIRKQLYVNEINYGVEAANFPGARKVQQDLLDHWVPSPDKKDIRGWEWFFLQSLANANRIEVDQSSSLCSVDWPGDNQSVLWSDNENVVHYDFAKKKVVERFPRTGTSNTSIDVDSKRKRLASVEGSNEVVIYDMVTWKVLARCKLDAPCMAMCWSPNDQWLACLIREKPGASSVMVILDTQKFEVQRQIADIESPTVSRFAFSPDSRYVATGHRTSLLAHGHSVALWECENWTIAKQFPVGPNFLTSLQFNPKNGQLAVGSNEGAILIWDTDTEKLVSSIKTTRGIADVAWSPDGQRLATASADSTVVLWDASTFLPVGRPFQSDAPVTEVRFSPDSQKIVVASSDGSIRVFFANVGFAEKAFRLSDQQDSDQLDVSVAWSKDDRQVAVGAAFPTNIIQLDYEETISTVLGSYADWSFDGRYLASKFNEEVSIWDALGRNKLYEHPRLGYGLIRAWSPNRPLLAGLNRNQVWIWNVESNEYTHVPIEPKVEGEYQLRCLSWSPDGRRIAIGDRKGTIYWFDVESRRIVDQFQLSKANINYLSWSPDGKSIAVASSSPTIQIVSVEEMKVTQELDGHSFENWSVDWSPDGHRIASAGGDKQVIVWDPSISTPLISFSMSAEARSVAWSHNGHNLAAISQDGQVKVWSAEFGYSSSTNWQSR